MSTVLYIRTSDGVLIRFERMAQARDWLAAGRLTLNDRFLSRDGDWRPLLALVDLDGARVEEAGDREDLADAIRAEPGDTEVRVQVAPTWAVTTDEFLPPEESSFREPRSVVAVSVPDLAAPDGAATDEPTTRSAGEAAIPVDGGTQPRPPVEEAGLGRAAFADARGADGVRASADAEWDAASDGAARPTWGRRLVRIAGILVLAGIAGYAAWHWAGGSLESPSSEIPNPSSVSPAATPVVPVPEGLAGTPGVSDPDAVADPGTDEAAQGDDAGAMASRDGAAGDAAKDDSADEGVEPASRVLPAAEPAAAPRPSPAPTAVPARRPPTPPRPSAPPSGPSTAAASQTYDQHMAAGNRLRDSDPRAALAHYSVAAEAKPGQVTPVSAMGDCAMAMGDTDQAQRFYARALRMRDSYGPALIGMARLHKRRGDNASAADFYRRYLQVNVHGSQASEARTFLEAQGTAP